MRFFHKKVIFIPLFLAIIGLPFFFASCVFTPKEFSTAVVYGEAYQLLSNAYYKPVSYTQVTTTALKSYLKEEKITKPVKFSNQGLMIEKSFLPYPAGTAPIEWGIFLDATQDRLDQLASSPSEQKDHIANKAEKEARLLRPFFENLDPFSYYLTEKEASEFNAQLQNKSYAGIGISVIPAKEAIQISDVLPKGPAGKANLQSGDKITEIDGNPVVILPHFEQTIAPLKGKAGSKVQIKISRAQSAPFTVTLTREKLIFPSVLSKEDKGLLILTIRSFNDKTYLTLQEALKTYLSGKNPKGVILDLRNNPGGYVKEAVRIADFFLRKGLIVESNGRHKDAQIHEEAKRAALSSEIPLAVLINEGSASASEMLAIALQNNHRAITVGATSFGKGSMQSPYALLNKGQVNMTIAHFFGPGKYPINQQGIVPLVCVSKIDQLKTPEDLEKALAPHSNSYKNALQTKATKKLKQVCPSTSDDKKNLNFAETLLLTPSLYKFFINQHKQHAPVLKRS